MTETKTLQVSGRRYVHSYKTKELTASLDLLAWLDEQKSDIKCYWQGRDGVEIACVGSVLFLNEVPLFESGNESPAKFWGGRQFFSTQNVKDPVWDGFPSVGFFLPEYQLQKKGTTLHFLSQSINSPLTKQIDLFPASFSFSNHTLPPAQHFPSLEDWDPLVKHSLKKIREKVFEKIVLARRSTCTVSTHALSLLSRLKPRGCTRFAFQFKKGKMFIGATPERLYRRSGCYISTEAMAGTRPLGRGKELFTDPKELKEFRFVKTSIQENLKPLCSSIHCDEETIVQAASLYHLYSSIEATLKEGISDEQIIDALHPTAAMGGLPKEDAVSYLLHHEPFERGWYASPLGSISARETEFAVGIRSALVEPSRIHFFSGVGIVEDSIPEKEWEELQQKIAIWESL